MNVTTSRGRPLSAGLVCLAAAAIGAVTVVEGEQPRATSPVSRMGARRRRPTSTTLAKSGAGPLPSANCTNSQAASRRG